MQLPVSWTMQTCTCTHDNCGLQQLVGNRGGGGGGGARGGEVRRWELITYCG